MYFNTIKFTIKDDITQYPWQRSTVTYILLITVNFSQWSNKLVVSQFNSCIEDHKVQMNGGLVTSIFTSLLRRMWNSILTYWVDGPYDPVHKLTSPWVFQSTSCPMHKLTNPWMNKNHPGRFAKKPTRVQLILVSVNLHTRNSSLDADIMISPVEVLDN